MWVYTGTPTSEKFLPLVYLKTNTDRNKAQTIAPMEINSEAIISIIL